VHAPNAAVADQIEENSERVHSAAEDAATVAKVKGPELTGEPISAVEQFQAGASHVTASAAAEGQRDVESAKAASASYIEQAKNLASDAIAAAQSYLPESLVGQTSPSLSPHTSPSSHSNVSSFKIKADSVLDTAGQYAKAAQDALQSQTERLKGSAQGVVGTGSVQTAEQGRASDVPAISAPLESVGPHHTLGNTYPTSTNFTEIAESDPKAP